MIGLKTALREKRSGKDDESIIRRHLRPSFGTPKLRELNVAQAYRFVTDRSHLDKKTVSNLLTLLPAMLSCALDLEWLEKVPWIPITSPRSRATSVDDAASSAFSRTPIFPTIRHRHVRRHRLRAAKLRGILEMTGTSVRADTETTTPKAKQNAKVIDGNCNCR